MSDKLYDEDTLRARTEELEDIIKADNERLIRAGLTVGLYSGCDTAEIMAEEILSSRARIAELQDEILKAGLRQGNYIKELHTSQDRIAELEAEIDMLKQLSQPIEFWSDEKIQIYKSNEGRTMKSGYEEREK